MFGIDFYPTPREVIEQMIFFNDVKGKTFLEPSAGKGDIVDFLNEFGAERVLACEIDDNLRKILQGKCEIIGSDFLQVTSQMVSHVDYIVMNPPFGQYAKHILHAWEVAPEGCQIIALMNWDTYNSYNCSSELKGVINDYGEATNLGDCFSTAERKTDVNVALIKLFKPVYSADFDLDGFYLNEEELDIRQENGLMERNEIKLLVEHYVRALKVFDIIEEQGKIVCEYMKALGVYQPSVGVSITHNDNVTTKESFARKLQIVAWKKAFELLKIEKFITTNVEDDITRFVNKYSKYPFSVKNIYRMLDILLASSKDIIDTSIERAVDKYTKYTHENRYNVEGWKTNSAYMLNKTFICNHGVKVGWGGQLEVDWNSSSSNNIGDLEKAICYIKGYDWDFLHDDREDWEKRCREAGKKVDTKKCSLYDYFCDNKVLPGEWQDWGLFEFKAFKKGTIHFRFKNESDWEALNRAYAKIKGQTLSEKI